MTKSKALNLLGYQSNHSWDSAQMLPKNINIGALMTQTESGALVKVATKP